MHEYVMEFLIKILTQGRHSNFGVYPFLRPQKTPLPLLKASETVVLYFNVPLDIRHVVWYNLNVKIYLTKECFLIKYMTMKGEATYKTKHWMLIVSQRKISCKNPEITVYLKYSWSVLKVVHEFFSDNKRCDALNWVLGQETWIKKIIFLTWRLLMCSARKTFHKRVYILNYYQTYKHCTLSVLLLPFLFLIFSGMNNEIKPN